MKKLYTIFLAALLLFNLVGYKVWFYYQQVSSAQRMQASVDSNDYDEKDLITIKVPMSMPYFTEWKDFERYDGSIEVNGQHYNYVKRKVSNDTLILLCLPNHEQNRLSESKNIYDNLAGNGPSADQNGKSGASLLLNSLLFGCRQTVINYQFSLPPLSLLRYKIINNNITATGCITTPWQSPDIIS